MNQVEDCFSGQAKEVISGLRSLNVTDFFDDLMETYDRPLRKFSAPESVHSALLLLNQYNIETHRDDPEMEGIQLVTSYEFEKGKVVRLIITYRGFSPGSVSLSVECVRGPGNYFYLFGDQEFANVVADSSRLS